MRVSDKWLKELVDINDSTEEIANKMLFAGNEYESIEKICPSTNLVVGRVISKKAHPDSDHLNVCEVDLGDRIYQIVCGAPNVDANQKVIVARVGAKLPAGEIKATTIRGIESNGMICSLAELGLESKYVKEDDKRGIHVLSEDAPVGVDALTYLNYDDSYVDYELTSNRGDLLSMLGMAYEVGAIYSKKVKEPIIDLKEVKDKAKDHINIVNETNNCNAYLSRIVRDIEIKDSPEFIKSRLMCAGIRPINNVVDISNYVMLEYGQPLHFFDYDKLGSNIVIRQAKKDEEIVTLDKTNRKLRETDIVICDLYKPVALAGVMGGFDTEIKYDTKSILIESAIFNPYNIRYTSKEILRSEASMRFEKGINPEATKKALDRAAYLLQKYAGGEVLNGVVGFNNQDLDDKEIIISIDKINKILGMDIPVRDIKDIFYRLGFELKEKDNKLKVMVPVRRLDINIEEDLIEEVGRIYGYDNMIGILPITSIKKGNNLPKNKYINNIKNRLYTLGLNEVITYSLISKEEFNLFKDEDINPIILESPLNEDRSILRYSLLPSLLKVADYNISRNIKDINIFEISKVYYSEYKEETKLGILMTGNYLESGWNNKLETDFYLIKGIVENLLKYLGVYSRCKFTVNDLPKEYHPGISSEILIDGNKIGYIGKIHPNINKNNLYLCELNIDKLFEVGIKKIKFKEIQKYPSIIKDISFMLDKNVNSIDIVNLITKKGAKEVVNVDVFDVFEIKDKKSIAFKLTFQDSTKTLTDEEVNSTLNEIIEAIEKEFNAELRNK
jgi:phenylalanyl-tRNA synthetase beta chain